MDSGRLIFDPAGGGGRQMLLFGGGGFFRGVPMSGAEDARRKRPFFTTHEELLLEEEYYDEQAPEKKRRLTPEQVQMLERSFEEDNKLEPERKSELARRLGVAPRQVAVWFQNRRARWKTKQLERDYGRLRAAYDALLADHRALLADSDRLRSQVSSLTDKLQAKEISASAAAGLEVESEVQTTVSATETAATAKPAGAVLPLKGQQDGLSTGTNGSAVVDVVEGTNHSDASYYTGEGYNCAEEEEAGVVSDEGCSFFPDAMLAAAVAHHEHAEDQEVAQIGNWSNWFWN